MKRKWKEREYNVQDHVDVAHKGLKLYLNKNQLPFCGPHPKPHGARG